MKKIKYILFSLLCLFTSIMYTKAANFNVSFSTNSQTVIVGNTYNLYIKVSSTDSIGTYSFDISHSSNLTIIGCNPSDDYGYYRITGDGGTDVKSKSYTCSFKATSSGTGSFSASSIDAVSDSFTNLSGVSGSTSVNAMTYTQIQETYSKDNKLATLGVEGYNISPEFNSDTLEYTLDVENNIDKVYIKTTKGESHQSILGDGEITLSEGVNIVKIDVEAQNGNIKTYTINITRKELNPITVKVDNITYTVVRKKENLVAPNTLFTDSTIKIQDEEIPCFVNEKLDYTLVGLKDEKGSINLFNYIDGIYSLYREINSGNVIIIPIDDDKILYNYKNYEVKINKITYNVLKSNKNSKFDIIYGLNLETGNKSYYVYDENEKTLQRFNIEDIEIINQELIKKQYIIYGLVFIVIVLIILLIFKLSKNNDKKINNKKKIKEDAIEQIQPVSEDIKVEDKLSDTTKFDIEKIKALKKK